MIRGLYTAATGMKAQETAIDTIANNLANVNTTSFKKSRTDFQDLMYQILQEPGAPNSGGTSESPSGIQIGLGVKTSSVQKIFVQGDLNNTGNQLDLAIEGDGFFQVTNPNGDIFYTRAGNFQLDQNGQLVTSDGYLVDPTITVPTDALKVTVAADGTVSARVPGATEATNLGQITAVRFQNNGGLRAVGQNLYQETVSSGTPTAGIFGTDGVGRLQQGFLEGSNVSTVDEVVNMIKAQRAYEASSKAITTADDMIQQAIQVKR